MPKPIRSRARPHSGGQHPVAVVPKHHALVRLSHWINVPLLLGLIASGLAIYWAAPVFVHARDPATGSRDYLADLGIAIARRLHAGGDTRHWVYEHFSLGVRQLAAALRLHWALAYLFMANGLLYAIGLLAGGGWRALLPRPADVRDALRMTGYYLGVIPMAILRRPWPHPLVRSKYNALQRGAYFTVALAGLLVVLSGWAMHKPVQLPWLERLFLNYDGARIVHFACMLVLAAFIVPHIVLAIADGWDTLRSMVVGWSKRVREHFEGDASTAGAARKRRRGLVGAFAERPEVAIQVPRRQLAAQSRRDFLFLTAGGVVSLAGAWWLLPDRTKARIAPGGRQADLDTLGARVGLSRGNRERVLDRVLTFDDDVAEALYTKDRRVRTYSRSQVERLPNNYNGRTPGPGYLAAWSLAVTGLASGRDERLTIADLLAGFRLHDQVTRLVCVEGWSAIAWWGGIRFADFLRAYPPGPGARWAALRSTVNLDLAGRPDPYYVSIDLETALHPQTLLATHVAGRPLPVAHGAPLRLLAPMKLGLKNIKAITEIAYTRDEPPDYWHQRGYSRYDGL